MAFLLLGTMQKIKDSKKCRICAAYAKARIVARSGKGAQ
jgi:hypothetical protein